ncbi:M-phase inducer phosphatase-like isoform X1 [Culex pipiens pallens]|uniref:M-phase inducer phosphatase-like isoform X1 n=1 Tax=Culex pipiens pallens TaxID=42434 RepID=UPI00195474BA|nr:M-phase inducer phosphatase-like isoform X1 [Culex pipiens pallens]XP_039436589.1 M-phase inducer phosphatase-like isoform X1 [Culex pipiens pallens]
MASNSGCESPAVVTVVDRLQRQESSGGVKIFGLSPVSEIAVNLQEATLDTPKGPTRRVMGGRALGKVIPSIFRSQLEAAEPVHNGSNTAAAGDNDDDDETDSDGDSGGFSDQQVEPDSKDDDKSRISTTFTLNSAGRSPASRLAEQRQRSAQRRLHIAPLKMLASPGKENLHTEEDLSFYQVNSPQASPRPCSPCECPEEESSELLPSEVTPNKQITVVTGSGSATRTRRPLEDYDPNSMDSGYGMSSSEGGHHKSQSMFRFIQPSIPRQNSVSSSTASPSASSSTPSIRIFHSLSSGSMESMDDIDMELFDMDTLEDEEGQQLPSNLSSLICGDIKATKTTPENKRPPFIRRCLSLSENPVVRRAKNNLIFESPVATATAASPARTPERFRIAPDQENLNLTPFSSRTQDTTRCFKRPEPPGVSPIQSKRHKTESLTPVSAFRSVENVNLDSPARLTVPKRPILQKSISMNDAHIMNALSRSSTEPDLIGDFSKSYTLPLMDGRHRDLKSISPDTMADLLRSSFDERVASFKIIDCRYPYEFEGGHIRGALNLYTQEQILEELIRSKTEPPTVETNDLTKRNIIVFHCEFSSERGPKLSRFLRNHDRILNSDSYPALHYPEIYLLHGGYKDFFAAHPDLCDPIAYRPMLDPNFGDAYRHFRAKSKSWNGADPVKGSAVSLGSANSSSSTSAGASEGRGPPTRLVKSRSRLVL